MTGGLDNKLVLGLLSEAVANKSVLPVRVAKLPSARYGALERHRLPHPNRRQWQCRQTRKINKNLKLQTRSSQAHQFIKLG